MIDGLILAGGQGRRLGLGLKHEVQIEQRTMLEHCVQHFAPQVDRLWINLPVIPVGLSAHPAPDTEFIGQGPLSGIHSGLMATDAEWLAIVAVDAVRVPDTLVHRLRSCAQNRVGAYVEGQYTCALLHRSLRDNLHQFMQQGGRAVRLWFKHNEIPAVSFDGCDALVWSVNTPEELARVRRAMKARQQ